MDYKNCIQYISGLNTQSICAFVGAGLSKPCGMPDWEDLVQPYAKNLNLNTKELPYPRVLQYALSQKAEYSFFLEKLKGYGKDCHPQIVHRLLARLGLSRVWTTNYDGLIEEAYQDEGIPYQIVAEDKDLYTLDYQNNQIVKMHGSLTKERLTDIVLLESEYENYIFYRKKISHLLENDIRNKNMLYFGFSFDDPNIRRIVSSIWNQKDNGKPSFLFTVPPSEKRKKIYYDCWKNDLSRYNINVVELSKYEEINHFLYEVLANRFGKTALLIGKRDDTTFNSLSYKIGYRLAELGYKIHSGGGPNISHSMANGAWDYLESKKIAIDNKVVFYYRYQGGSTNPQKGQISYCGATRSEVRKKMITSDKICILIGDEPPSESGIQEEIGIAYKKGARIIPIGCTGGLARKLWKAEKHNYIIGAIFEESNLLYDILNNDSATEEQIADAVVKLAEYLLVRNYEK